MTTTITLKTHDWPVEIKMIDEHETEKMRRFAKTLELIDPHSKREMHIASTRRITFTKLPLPKQPSTEA